jgi:hypothetical protein
VAIPAAVFNDQVDRFVSRLSDGTVRNQLAHGGAYALAGTSFVSKLGADASTVIGVYTDSLQTVWLVGLAFALLGFVLVGLERHIELRSTLETDFGLAEKAEAKAEDGVVQIQGPKGNVK